MNNISSANLGFEKMEPTWNLFDADQELSVGYRHLPHWEQAGATYFVTFRLVDSLPQNIIESWADEARSADVEAELKPTQDMLLEASHRKLDLHLDNCHGDCILSDPECAEIVRNSLLHFDKERYWISDLVIMPNHVHLICTMQSEWSIRKQCGSWMRYSATEINKVRGSSGAVWQDEAFDHIVRSEEQLHWLRGYIANNPIKAKLNENEYLMYQYDR